MDEREFIAAIGTAKDYDSLCERIETVLSEKFHIKTIAHDIDDDSFIDVVEEQFKDKFPEVEDEPVISVLNEGQLALFRTYTEDDKQYLVNVKMFNDRGVQLAFMDVIEITGLHDFHDDAEKMRDFSNLTKGEFLSSYSYLTVEEYEMTAEYVRSTDFKNHAKSV